MKKKCDKMEDGLTSKKKLIYIFSLIAIIFVALLFLYSFLFLYSLYFAKTKNIDYAKQPYILSNSIFNATLLKLANQSDFRINNLTLYPSNCSNPETRIVNFSGNMTQRYLSSVIYTNNTMMTDYISVPVKSGEIMYAMSCYLK